MELIDIFDKAQLETKHKKKKITFLTGAGISAESGIPTYRGKGGYWIKGSENYRPEETGTYKFFQAYPYQVWQFTLYRKTLFEQAQPNRSHYVLVEIEKALGERFHLITQNIDGLHLRAGNSREKTYQIHGSLEYVRCSKECTKALYPFPQLIKEKEEEITDQEWDLLKCPNCGNITRPNILWFDEYYNERLFKLHSALRIAKDTGILFVVGTSGATNLPNQLVSQVLKYGGTIVDINVEDNHFAQIAREKKNGYAIQGKSSEVLPLIQQTLEKTKIE